MLWLTKRVIFGKTVNDDVKGLKDTNKLENLMLISLAFLIIFFGFYPVPLFETLNISIDNLIINYEQSINEFRLAKND